MGCADGSCCGHSDNKGIIEFPGTYDHNTPWKFYNHLIGAIPEDILVTGCCLGTHWSYVETECGMGVGYTASGGGWRTYTGELRGLKLREVAELSKSWNFYEASLGVAALNAWYAQKDKVDALGALYDPGGKDSEDGANKSDIFEVYRDRLAGKKVTIIGHFPHVERTGEVAAELIVLERNCTSKMDTPDPACEYLLPSQDFVFMTGVTIINKTAPRLFDLAKSATTIMVGPSVVPSPFLFQWGVDVLAGSIVVDPEKTRALVEQGAGMMFGDAIRMMRIESDGFQETARSSQSSAPSSS